VTHPFLRPSIQAILSRNVPSKEGRLDFIRVRLQKTGDGVIAVPVPGKSGVISAMVRAHGCVRIEADCEGLYKGDEVIVNLFADWIEESLEKKHLPRHEAPRRGAGDIFGPSQQEKLSTF
jgi:molybdopterin molybdotransferase